MIYRHQYADIKAWIVLKEDEWKTLPEEARMHIKMKKKPHVESEAWET